jgi:chemotaxis protein methyltransferase CheR
LEKRIFRELADIIYDESGIHLADNKMILMENRVRSRLKELNLDDVRDYLSFLKEGDKSDEIVKFLDVISTNVTYFFREEDHFRFLANFFRRLYQLGQRDFKIWCAAASSGQEPYSILITVLEALRGQECRLKFLATDISQRALKKALAGVYAAKDIEPVSPELRKKYFQYSASDNRYQVKEQYRKMITFARLNLKNVPYKLTPGYDLVICRNCLIYFDDAMRATVIDNFARLLKTNAPLIVGHSESLNRLSGSYRMVKPSIYMRI